MDTPVKRHCTALTIRRSTFSQSLHAFGMRWCGAVRSGHLPLWMGRCSKHVARSAQCSRCSRLLQDAPRPPPDVWWKGGREGERDIRCLWHKESKGMCITGFTVNAHRGAVQCASKWLAAHLTSSCEKPPCFARGCSGYFRLFNDCDCDVCSHTTKRELVRDWSANDPSTTDHYSCFLSGGHGTSWCGFRLSYLRWMERVEADSLSSSGFLLNLIVDYQKVFKETIKIIIIRDNKSRHTTQHVRTCLN